MTTVPHISCIEAICVTSIPKYIPIENTNHANYLPNFKWFEVWKVVPGLKEVTNLHKVNEEPCVFM